MFCGFDRTAPWNGDVEQTSNSCDNFKRNSWHKADTRYKQAVHLRCRSQYRQHPVQRMYCRGRWQLCGIFLWRWLQLSTSARRKALIPRSSSIFWRRNCCAGCPPSGSVGYNGADATAGELGSAGIFILMQFQRNRYRFDRGCLVYPPYHPEFLSSILSYLHLLAAILQPNGCNCANDWSAPIYSCPLRQHSAQNTWIFTINTCFRRPKVT